jgi:hypothetical protein
MVVAECRPMSDLQAGPAIPSMGMAPTSGIGRLRGVFSCACVGKQHARYDQGGQAKACTLHDRFFPVCLCFSQQACNAARIFSFVALNSSSEWSFTNPQTGLMLSIETRKCSINTLSGNPDNRVDADSLARTSKRLPDPFTNSIRPKNYSMPTEPVWRDRGRGDRVFHA